MHRAPVTAVPTVIKAATGTYDVRLPGLTFFNLSDAATCTAESTGSRFVSVTSLQGQVRVFVANELGTRIDGGFYCSVYDLP